MTMLLNLEKKLEKIGENAEDTGKLKIINDMLSYLKEMYDKQESLTAKNFIRILQNKLIAEGTKIICKDRG